MRLYFDAVSRLARFRTKMIQTGQVRLPPDPGGVGKITIEGIDSDHDGARNMNFKASAESVAVIHSRSKGLSRREIWRDSKICAIGEGTSEVQRLVNARELLTAV